MKILYREFNSTEYKEISIQKLAELLSKNDKDNAENDDGFGFTEIILWKVDLKNNTLYFLQEEFEC